MKQAMQQRHRISHRGVARAAGFLLVCGTTLLGCHHDMWDQPKFIALQESDFYADGAASRPHVAGTVTYDGARRKWSAPVFKDITGSPTVPSANEMAFWKGKLDGKVRKAIKDFEVEVPIMKKVLAYLKTKGGSSEL